MNKQKARKKEKEKCGERKRERERRECDESLPVWPDPWGIREGDTEDGEKVGKRTRQVRVHRESRSHPTRDNSDSMKRRDKDTSETLPQVSTDSTSFSSSSD